MCISVFARSSEHPVEVAGHREAPSSVAAIGQRQRRELDRRVDGDVDAQRRIDPVLAVLEDAVAEAVARDVGARASRCQ
jgi:hypothetical protein